MAAKRLVFDIETYRTRNQAVIDELTAEAINKRPAQNVQKELKLAWDTEQGRRGRVETALAKTSVNVMYAEVLCIAAAVDSEEAVVFDGMSNPEAEMLVKFSDWVDNRTGAETTWIGHNITAFDLPVLLSRYRSLCLFPPMEFPVWTGRRWTGRVFDTMLRTPCENGMGMVSLEKVCRVLGMDSPKSRYALEDGTPLDGSTVGLAYERGEYAAILAYSQADVEVERELYLRLTFGSARDCWECEDRSAEEIEAVRDQEGLSKEEKAWAMLNMLAARGVVSRDLLPG